MLFRSFELIRGDTHLPIAGRVSPPFVPSLSIPQFEGLLPPH
jgi:hypothetical protein